MSQAHLPRRVPQVPTQNLPRVRVVSSPTREKGEAVIMKSFEAVVLDTLAAHIRRCAVLSDDAKAVDILMRAARELDDRSEELRVEARKTTAPPPSPGDMP